MCRCWLDGTTRTPPPHAEHVAFDEEGQLCLTLPEERQDAHDAFYAWMEDCCPHPRMWLASEWISNWAGLRAFQAALDRIGWQHFPTLHAELPAANGGMMPAGASARALGELARFAELVASVRSAFLVDSETGHKLYDFIPQYEGIFPRGAARAGHRRFRADPRRSAPGLRGLGGHGQPGVLVLSPRTHEGSVSFARVLRAQVGHARARSSPRPRTGETAVHRGRRSGYILDEACPPTRPRPWNP
ncbi:hypothetical protein [Sorangium sp. So ce128]|uniref:hypothetical protein n=1 Tax=Sorangium sp. So ce128 TaxID=3133281 RepID=UPI003F5E2828